MSAERVITAEAAGNRRVEAFPYFTAQFYTPLEGEETQDSSEDPDDDSPLALGLRTPEDDAARLAEVDQLIVQKLQEAEREAQDIARRGYEEGFASGEQEGRQFGESQYKAHIQRLDGHLQELSRSFSLNERAAKDEVLALALALGEYLAGREIEKGEQTIRPLLDTLLDTRPFPAAKGEGAEYLAMTVYLHPKDLEELSPDARNHPGISLREDPDLSRGGLRMESPAGVLDASLERRQANLLTLLQSFRETELP